MRARTTVLAIAVTVLAVACGGGGDAGTAGSWEDRLAQLPFIDPAEATAYVTMGDLAAAAGLADITWPPAEGEDPLEALGVLGGLGDSAVAVPFPPVVSLNAVELVEELRDTIGVGLEDLDWLATASAPPMEATIGGGRVDADAAAAALGDGPPWRLGQGEDLEADFEAVTPLDPLGRPITVTVVDGTLGWSTVAEGVTPLADGGPSLADVEPLRRLIALADEEGCYAVEATSSEEGGTQMVCTLPEVGEGPQVVLMGVGLEDPQAEADRIRAVDTRDRIDAIEVTVDDDLVRVDVDHADDVPARVVRNLLTQLDPLVPGFG